MWIRTAYNELLNLNTIALISIIVSTYKQQTTYQVAAKTGTRDNHYTVIKEFKTEDEANVYLNSISRELNSVC
jgi:hypothetical protein